MTRLTACLALLGLLGAVPLAAAGKHDQGKLSWQLHRVAAEAEAGAPVRALGRRFVDERSQRVTAVAVLEPGAAVEELRGEVERAGGTIDGLAAEWGWVRLRLPASALRRVAASPTVRRLRTPYYPHRKEVVSEGAGLIRAPEFAARTGADGSGVTVAILDSAYQGLAERIGSELPADTEVSDFVRQRLDGYDDAHGTACAEIVHDVAPGARLLILGFEDGVSYVDALNTLIDRRVPIVSHSIGFDNLYPADGDSPFSRAVNIVARNGTLFVTAAGNEAGRYYKGPYADADANGVVEFAGGSELLPIGVFGGDSTVILRWDDSYGAASQDYDLFVVRREFRDNPVFSEDNPAIVASSQDLQDGTQDPLEVLTVEIEEDEVLYAVIRYAGAVPVKADQHFSLWSEGGVHPDLVSAASSLSLPADASGAVAVAAVNLELGLEGFSSRGPTDDGRVKPDLAAPDGVSTASYGTTAFFGTSAATPHVAGAAALILSLQPAERGAALRAKLERATASGGDAAAKDNDVGFGVVDLDRFQ
jgi:subtilisin family serine protease